MNENGSVNISVENGIAEIEFFHPKSNSLPGIVLKKIAESFLSIGNREDVKVIVLKSRGDKAFCAGASFDELIAIDTFEKGKEFFMGFGRVINAMRKCRQLIIARVQGKAVGGGVGIIAASDYSIAIEDASVKLSELAVGIGPFVVGPAVEIKIGKSAFAEMTIDFDWRSAEWALQKGLFNKVVSNSEQLDSEVNKLAQKLSMSNPEAMHQLKKVMWLGSENWDELLEKRAEISGQQVLSDFTKKYIQSFQVKN
jgi:methylglutaconyl-CoA hydratase